MTRYSDQELTPSEQYWLALYYIVTTITTVGYGDIVPHKESFRIREKHLSIVMMLVGQISFSYLAASLTAILTRSDRRNQNLEKHRALEQIIEKYGPLPIKLYQQLLMHI
jgi:hypothetical protein